MNKAIRYFSRFELFLWGISVIVIIASFIMFDNRNFLALSASLIGVTSLIFNAKGNPVGQLLMIVFSIIYGIISYSYSYYGEMITYLGMTAPMAAVALFCWIKNPYKGRKTEVKINRLKGKEYVFIFALAVVVTLIFYYILLFFDTANIVPSTISVTTSFVAVYLTFRRSPLFALAYAANDIVLIALWILASFDNSSYVSVVICFVSFLFNDLYGYYNWKKIQKRQASE